MLPEITGEFRAVDDPELIFTPSGAAVCKFRIVANSRKKEGDEWVDDKVCWLRVVTFKKLAENVAESVTKGALVLVTGRLQTEQWETQEGEKKSAYTVIANHVGPSLAFKPARILEPERAAQPAAQQPPAAPSQDPWGSPGVAPDEPPF